MPPHQRPPGGPAKRRQPMRPEDNKKRDNSSYLHTGTAPGGVCVE